jgi:predicted O-methyltransferase YrrM
MIEKLNTALWFTRRPSFYAHAGALALRKFLPDRDGAEERRRADEWGAARAVPVADALRAVGIGGEPPALDPALVEEGEARARRSAVAMGGPGDLSLLHAVTALTGAKTAVETGVAYGWSSLAILSAMAKKGGGRLLSVDMPYPKMDNEAFVGIVVPERLRTGWTLVREPDRNGLRRAIRLAGGPLDLAHYDSDKSYYGRQFAFPLIWDALRPGGVFISDDIQDNLAFAEFVDQKGVPFAVTESGGKYVGICVKPRA